MDLYPLENAMESDDSRKNSEQDCVPDRRRSYENTRTHSDKIPAMEFRRSSHVSASRHTAFKEHPNTRTLSASMYNPITRFDHYSQQGARPKVKAELQTDQNKAIAENTSNSQHFKHNSYKNLDRRYKSARHLNQIDNDIKTTKNKSDSTRYVQNTETNKIPDGEKQESKEKLQLHQNKENIKARDVHEKGRDRKQTKFVAIPNKEKKHNLYIILEETSGNGIYLMEYVDHRMGNPHDVDFVLVRNERLVSKEEKQLIVLSFRSSKQRLRARSLLNKSNRNFPSKISCFDSENDAKGVMESRTNDRIKALEEIVDRAVNVCSVHDEKLKDARKTFEIISEKLHARKGMSLLEFQNLTDQKPALEDKLEELTLQRKEFTNYIQAMKSKLREISDRAFDKEIRKIRIAFGAECRRLEAALPMYACREKILTTVRDNQVCVVLGETGSGKSTQMVQYLYQAGFTEKGQIVCTQPRKIAAITLAQRVASEMGCGVGQETGYRVGMQAKISGLTRLIFVTDHILLNECLKDELLSQYSCVIIDEAHERSIFTDLLLGMLKKCLQKRPELRVVVTSATIDPGVFTAYFASECNCPVLKVSGRTFPVEAVYEEDDYEAPFPDDYEGKALNKAIEVHSNNSVERGDILVFVTSPIETEKCCERFQQRVKKDDYHCLQLHGRLTPEEQQLVFAENKNGKRKIVFATNSAETSITIPGIRFVIDTGVAKEMQYDPKKNVNSLCVVPISQSSANQRKGRAGRVSIGTCYRLYTERDYERMDKCGKPEILRIHLGQGLLKLMEIGVNPLLFDFVESPSKDALATAIETLEEIDAVRNGEITELGRWISKLPIEPRLGALVKKGIDAGVPLETLVIAAYNNTKNIFFRVGSEEEKKKSDMLKINFCHEKGDIFTALNVFKDWHELKEGAKGQWCKKNSINGKSMKNIREMVKEIIAILQKDAGMKIKFEFSKGEDTDEILHSLVFRNTLRNLCVYLGHEKAGYLTLVKRQTVQLHPSSSLLPLGIQPTWAVFGQLLRTSDDFITDVTPITEELLDSAVDDNVLSIDKASFLAQQVKEAVKIPVGKHVFVKFVGPMHKNRRQLEATIGNTCNDATIIIDANKIKGELSLYCLSKYSQIAGDMLSNEVGSILTKLKYGALEEPLSTNKNVKSTRALLGRGGEVLDVLKPSQFRSVHVKAKDFCKFEVTEDCVTDMLEHYGHIEEVWRPFAKRGQNYQFWGKITFVNKEDAENAVDDMNSDEDCDIKLIPITFDTQNLKPQDYTLKLRWCRRLPRDHCFVSLNSPEDMSSILVERSINVDGDYDASVQIAKNGSDIMIRGLQSNVTEEFVRKGLLNLLRLPEHGNERRFKITIPREKLHPRYMEEDSVKTQIMDRVEEIVTDAKVRVDIRDIKDTSVWCMAFLRFADPTECEQVAEDMIDRGFSIYNREVDVDMEFKTNVFANRRVFRATERDILTFIKKWNSEHSSKVQWREMKSGNFSIDITATSPSKLANVKTKVDAIIDGDVFECGVTKNLDKVFTQNGKAEMRKIEKNTGVIITVDERTMKLSVQGIIEGRQRAVEELNKYLRKLGSAKEVHVQLKGESNPPGVMKALLTKYGIGLKQLVGDNGLVSVDLKLRDHELMICGFDDGITKTLDNIEDVKTALLRGERNLSADDLSDCPVCLCPIEIQDLCRLEYCGHAYCGVCLKSQIENAVKNKEFPINCAREECGKPVVIRDLTTQFRQGTIKKRHLVDASISDFVGKHKAKYRFCPTPDCQMVYHVSDISELFACPLCFKKVCTKCHKGYHDGITCEMNESVGRDGDSMLKWLKEKPDTRKLCPKCHMGIEKDGGCQHMTCKCGVHICWICLEFFTDSGACYGHLRRKHGSFI